MHVTPSLDRSYVVACDLPVPALTYLSRGHQISILLDEDAVTAFRRDGTGKTPLDRLDLLEEDYDQLADFLGVPRAALPQDFGALYRVMVERGVRLLANEEALRAHRVRTDDLDPAVVVVSGAEARHLMSDLDALLPYDNIGPMHSIFRHIPNGSH